MPRFACIVPGRPSFGGRLTIFTHATAPRPQSSLDESDRWSIQSLLSNGHSQRSIASALGVSPSTTSREVRRARTSGSSWYLAVLGQRVRVAARKRAGRKRRELGPSWCSPLARHVMARLHAGWSPEQIAGRLKAMDSSSPRISHETIYCAIYAQPRGTLRTELVKLLRKSHAGRLPRARGRARFTGLQGMTSIDLRLPEVAARIVPGHWEGDLIKGARNASAVGTIVERTSRFLMLVKLDDAGSNGVLEGMALHDALAKRLRMDIFFCDPHSPWQRGSNENANGLIREYLPKSNDLAPFTQQQLSAIEYSLNTRPRKILGFKTPLEVFSDLKLNNIAGAALQA